jgi:hypothetical protein
MGNTNSVQKAVIGQQRVVVKEKEPSTTDIIGKIKGQIELIHKKISYKTTLKDEEFKLAQKYAAKNDNDRAKLHLVKKKLLEDEITSLLAMELNLERQIHTLEGTILQVSLIASTKEASNVIKNTMVSASDVDETMSNMKEQMDNLKVIQGIMNEPIVEKDEELDRQMEELMRNTQPPVPPVAQQEATYTAPPQTPGTGTFDIYNKIEERVAAT